MAKTADEVLEMISRVYEDIENVPGKEKTVTLVKRYQLDQEKLAAILANILNRLEALENKPADAIGKSETINIPMTTTNPIRTTC